MFGMAEDRIAEQALAAIFEIQNLALAREQHEENQRLARANHEESQRFSREDQYFYRESQRLILLTNSSQLETQLALNEQKMKKYKQKILLVNAL